MRYVPLWLVCFCSANAAVISVVDQRDFWMGPNLPFPPDFIGAPARSMGTVTTTFYFDGPTPSGGLGQWAGADVLIDVEPWVATYGPNDEVSQTIRITEWPIFRGLKRDGGNWHFDTEFGLVDANLVWEVTLEGPETTINRTYTNTLSSAFDQAQINTSATNPWLMQIWLWHTQSGGTIDGVTVPSPEGIMLLPFVPEPSSGLLLLYAVLPLAAAHIREPRPRPA